MASLDDLLNALNDANGRLDNLKASTDAVTAAVNNAATQITTSLNSGFGQLIALGQYTNTALYHNSQQNDTIICILEHISRNTCDLVTQSHLQTALQQHISDETTRLAELYSTVHADAELQRLRLLELRREVERCCPPEKPPPACTYEPCPKPGELAPPVSIQRPG